MKPVGEVAPEMKFSEMKFENPTEFAGAFGLLMAGRSLVALPSPFRSIPPTNGVCMLPDCKRYVPAIEYPPSTL